MKPKAPNAGKKQPKGNYEVGFARTPEATRFKPGNQAARKNGRPAGRENNQTILQRIIDFKVAITLPGGKERKMGLWEASAWKQAVKAAQGDTRAFNAVNDLAERFGVVLFDPPPLDNELTVDEEADIEAFFVDWAMTSPQDAWCLLHRLEAMATTVTKVRGRDASRVRCVDFRWASRELPERRRATTTNREAAP